MEQNWTLLTSTSQVGTGSQDEENEKMLSRTNDPYAADHTEFAETLRKMKRFRRDAADQPEFVFDVGNWTCLTGTSPVGTGSQDEENGKMLWRTNDSYAAEHTEFAETLRTHGEGADAGHSCVHQGVRGGAV